MYSLEGDVNGAIVQYKKVIALDPSNVDAHYNLGAAFEKKGDFDSSIREYREVKRLDPRRYDGRHNLAAALLNHNFNAEAVLEFRGTPERFSRRCPLPLLFGTCFASNLGPRRRGEGISAGDQTRSFGPAAPYRSWSGTRKPRNGTMNRSRNTAWRENWTYLR